MRRYILFLVAAAVLTLFGAGLLVGLLAGRAWAQSPSPLGPGDHHPLHADHYQKWQRPDGAGSCCNNQDCRPTRAFLGDDGLWRAWDGRDWLVIPASKLLPADHAGDGRSHLCATPEGTVYCFSPSQPKI